MASAQRWAALALLGFLAVGAEAGDLDPPGAPAPTPPLEPRIAISGENTPGNSQAVFRIVSSGSYFLAAPLSGEALAGKSGILIEASDVAIDLGGFTLIGAAGSTNGVRAIRSLENVTVRNGTVEGWGDAGLNLSSVSGARVVSVVVRGCADEGVLCGPNSTVRDCTVIGNGDAGIEAAENSLVVNCVAQGCHPGIAVAAGSLVESCVASGNTSEGFQITEATASRCRSDANSGRGFVLTRGTLMGCVGSSNATHGVEAYGNFTVRDGVFQRNSGVGICAADPTGATDGGRIEGNTVTQNQCGIWSAQETVGLLIVRNHASDNELNYEIMGTHILGPILTGIDEMAPTDPWANFSF